MLEFLRRLDPIWRPHPGQLDFLLAPNKIKVLACGRRWGKTDACAVQILYALQQPEPSRHLLLAPTADQAKILYDRILLLMDKLGMKPETRATPYPSLKWRGHRVEARSGHVGRSLRGHEAHHIVVDEAAFVPEELVSEVAMPMLATTDGCLTLISTPYGLNHFYRYFKMGERGEHGIWSRRGPSSEPPFVSANFLAMQRELIYDRAYRVEYEAEFVAGAGTIFEPDDVAACVVPRVEPPPEQGVSIGLDWGRYRDATALVTATVLDGIATVHRIASFQGMTWEGQFDRIQDFVAGCRAGVITADCTGIGDYPTDELARRVKLIVRPYSFNQVSKNVLVDRLSHMVSSHRLRFEPHPGLLREMEHYQMDENGKVGGIGYHDDIVTALALAINGLPHGGPAAILTGAERRFNR